MLKFRIISATVILTTLTVISIWAPPWGLFLVVCCLAVLSSWELFSLLKKAGLENFRLLGAGLVLVFQIMVYKSLQPICFIGFWPLVLMILFLLQLFLYKTEDVVARISHTLMGLMYIGGFMSFIVLLLFGWDEGDGRWLVLYYILVVKGCDIGAYSIGCALGRHKLIPSVSPAKSWEGCAGGLGLSIVVSLIIYYISGKGNLGVVHLDLSDALILPVLLACSGILGDLSESLIKRSLEIKDSGKLIAGMGGVLDVMDSLLFAAPVAYVYAQFFLDRI